MSDSNNIYNILGKLEALKPTAQEKHDATVQQIRESVEAQGSILKGLREVGSVEQRLAKQFAESKIEEKAVSQAQQKFMGMVHAAQKGSKAASPAVAKVAKSMGKKDAKDFAATKHKGLPQHVNEKYNPVKAVKQCAKSTMEMNGIASVHDLDAEDIEYIGDECQMNYQDVCEILGCNLPDSLGPVKSWDTDEQGNKFDLEEATCNECGMTMESCGCEHTNEGIGDSIKLAFGKTMAWVVDTAAKFANTPELKDKMTQARVDLANKAEQQMLATIAGHPREEQLKQQVNYIVTQLKQQQTMQDLITVAQKLGAEFKAERSKFSETDTEAQPGGFYGNGNEPAGSPGEPVGTVTVSADPDSGVIDPSEYIEEAGDFGQQLNDLFGQVYDYGDDGLDYLDSNAPTWTALFDKHDGDIDAIVANEPDEVLAQAVEELEGIVSDLPYELGEAEIIRKPGVTTHRKTEFPGYPADDIDDLDDLRGPGTGKRGRPRKHAAKVPTGLGRGRPVKAKAPTFSKQADPFGRVTGKVPAGKKGTVHTMAESMNLLGTRLLEGINFQKMAEETNQTIDELMNDLQNDIKEYKATGHCSDTLKDFMQVHAHSKKQMADEAVAGIGQDLVSPQQRVAQATPHQPGIMGAVKDVAQGAKNWIQGKPEQGPTYEEVTMEDELNELAKLAGLGEATRGEHIKQKDAEAEKSGKDKFQAFGQEFDTDKVEEEETDEGNTFTDGLQDDDVKIGDKIPGTNAIKKVDIDESTNFDGEESSDFNINTSMSSNGDKNVTVSATGEHAATLLQMLRIAGLGNGDKAQELQAEPEVEVISIDGEEGVEEESIDVDQPATKPVNAPHEKYGTIKNITTQGDDMNREKSQDPATANKAANPMTNAQSVLKAVAQLESKLAEEYESIKKVSK